MLGCLSLTIMEFYCSFKPSLRFLNILFVILALYCAALGEVSYFWSFHGLFGNSYPEEEAYHRSCVFCSIEIVLCEVY